MKLGINLLSPNTQTVNGLQYLKQLALQKGDTTTLIIQLTDQEQCNNRYMPQQGQTILTTTGSVLQYSNLLTSLSTIAGLAQGQAITGPNIPPGTTIAAPPSGTTVLMSNEATGNTSGNYTFLTYGATVQINISRYPEYFGNIQNNRITKDYSVVAYAAMLFPEDDRSVWYLPLTSEQTQNMSSSGVLVTLNENQSVKSVTAPALIVASNQLET